MPLDPAQRRLPRRLLMLAGALVLASTSLPAAAPADTASRIAVARTKESRLRNGIARDSSRIHRFQPRLNELRQRLSAIETSLRVERDVLGRVQGELRGDRAKLTGLRLQLAQDQQRLSAQLVAAYETPAPDIATVVLDAHGFSDLMDRLDNLKVISRHNAQATQAVGQQRQAVAEQTQLLAGQELRQRRITDATSSQQRELDRLRLAVVSEQLRFIRARSRKGHELGSLRRRRAKLQRRLSAQPAGAAKAGYGGHGAALVSPSAGFSPHGGDNGFFPAAGTNYSVGDEPQLAARLDTMGRALGLHLIGVSGYRSPQHSVEVGGFANDPHTRGQASDTPGLEGVPEATLNRYGLTRPFPGPAEADHVQLLGSSH